MCGEYDKGSSEGDIKGMGFDGKINKNHYFFVLKSLLARESLIIILKSRSRFYNTGEWFLSC